MSSWIDAVQSMKKDLLEQKGISVDRVIMTSDEEDPKWWSEVTAQGWLTLDHEKMKTKELMGEWYAKPARLYFVVILIALLGVQVDVAD
jgi:hypothetical protein